MIKSMTGYGAGKKLIKSGFIRVEIRTLNHRYLDIVTRLPESCLVFENQIKDLIKQVTKKRESEFISDFRVAGEKGPSGQYRF